MFEFLSKKPRPVIEGSKKVYLTFQKRRRQIFRLAILSFVLTFIALAIVGTKIFYPFHVIVGVGIYVLSFIPFASRVYLTRKVWREYRTYKWSIGFLKRERAWITFLVIFLISAAIFLWLRPLDASPFKMYTDDEMVSLVQDDLYVSVSAMDYLESSGNKLLELLESGREDENLNKDLTEAFGDFLEAVMYSETLTETHRYFGSIPYRLQESRESSFLISYSLYAKKYELVHRIMLSVNGHDRFKTILNQPASQYELANVYNEMVERFYAPKTRIRLSAGYLYMLLFLKDEREAVGITPFLINKAGDSYGYLRSNFTKTVTHSGEVLADAAERRMFEAWFPVQKNVAIAMGRAVLSTRGKSGLITEEQALAMEQHMEPGDIMLQRRNWHLSNVGIPGFWTHSALYTGSLEVLDAYFAPEFPYAGYENFSQLLQSRYPQVYADYKASKESESHPFSVIEAIEPGVILQSLPVSADADFVVVLRPKLSKSDKLKALLAAYTHHHKPYDFDFNFDTKDALVCSELIFDAYLADPPDKNGLLFETSLVSGRRIVSPFDIAHKYVAELDTPHQSLEFIYFLEGDESTARAVLGTKSRFISSLQWSKSSFMQLDGNNGN